MFWESDYDGHFEACLGKVSIKNDIETVKQRIVETIEASRLTDIRTSDLVAFMEKRAIYERQMAEIENADSNVCLPLTTYRNSTDDSLLQLCDIANWVEIRERKIHD